MADTLVDYVKKNLKKGYTAETLKFALIKQGYSRVAIETAIKKAQKELAQEVPQIREKPEIKHEIYDEYNKPIVIESESVLSRILRFFKR